jgi:hypothetical protein
MRRIALALIFCAPLAYGSQIVNPSTSGGGGGGGSGTVNSGTNSQVAYYSAPGSSTTVSGTTIMQVFASSAAVNGQLDMKSNNVTGVLDAVVSSHAINLSQLANVASANAIINPNFDGWYNGTSSTSPALGTAVASSWLMSSNLTLGGSWFVSQNTVTTHNAKYSAQITVTGFQNNTYYGLRQSIPNYQPYLGSSVTLTAWVNSNVAQTISITDNVGGSTSTASSAGAGWQQLSVTRYISSSVTSLSVTLGSNILSSLQNSFYDNVMIVPGDAPINYIQVPQGIVGVTDGSSATAGNVGEWISAAASAVNLPTSGNWGDATSIALTAGDWEVWLYANTGANGATVTDSRIGLSTTSGNTAPSPFGDTQIQTSQPGAVFNGVGSMNQRFSFSTPTTVYFKMEATYTAATPQIYGRITARRMR